MWLLAPFWLILLLAPLVAVSPAAALKIYFADEGNNKIWRADMAVSNSNIETLVTDGDVTKALDLLEGVKKAYPRTEWGDTATARAKELKADTRAKALLAAGKSVSKSLRRLTGKTDEKPREAVLKSLKKLQGKAKEDAASYIGRFVEIFSKKWVKAKT